MALVFIQDCSLGVKRVGPKDQAQVHVAVQDNQTNQQYVIPLTMEASEKLYKALGETLGKGEGIQTATPEDMAKVTNLKDKQNEPS